MTNKDLLPIQQTGNYSTKDFTQGKSGQLGVKVNSSVLVTFQLFPVVTGNFTNTIWILLIHVN